MQTKEEIEKIIDDKVKKMMVSAQNQIINNIKKYCMKNRIACSVTIGLTADTEIDVYDSEKPIYLNI